MERSVLVICVLFMISCLSLFAHSGKIDVEKDNKLVERLTSKSEETVNKAIEETLVNLDKKNPVVLCVAGYAMFQAGDEFEGVKVFLIGRIRVIYDIRRCNDASVGGALSVIDDSFGECFITYRDNNTEKYKEAKCICDTVL